jgi:hypothetical protein
MFVLLTNQGSVKAAAEQVHYSLDGFLICSLFTSREKKGSLFLCYSVIVFIIILFNQSSISSHSLCCNVLFLLKRKGDATSVERSSHFWVLQLHDSVYSPHPDFQGNYKVTIYSLIPIIYGSWAIST